jgi:alpha-mannosidase
MFKIKIYIFFLMILFAYLSINAQNKKIDLTPEGFIPAWLVCGPFEQPLFGFGVPADKDMIGEKNIEPFWGKIEQDALLKDNNAEWLPQSTSSNEFLDLNNSLRWQIMGNHPEKIWYALTGYAAAYIESSIEQNAIIKYGSNSFGKILVNGEEVYSITNPRNAVVDQDEIKIKLKKGKNLILVKVGNSNANHELAFFEIIKWEWGFYLKLLNEQGNPLKNVQLIVPEKIDQPEFEIVSTFFFKKSEEGLKQRFDIEIMSPLTESLDGIIEFNIDQVKYSFKIDSIPFGLSRHEIFIEELDTDKNVTAVLSVDNQKIEKNIKLLKQKHYKFHMMMLSHTDIGYTHPQPVVKEIHSFTLDEVIEMCEKHEDFSWTIETLWQLEQYEQSRTPAQFQKIIDLIKEGRIAVSPLYSNPFSGWVSEEEMIRSLEKAKEYQEKFGLKYNAAVYNDVPGQAWMLPQVLKNAGVDFLAEGLNEFFNDYSFQRSLPKAFIWQGSDGSEVVTYRNEAYNEGKALGLESRGNLAVQQRMWERLNKLKAAGDDMELLLLNSAYTDNSIVPRDQYYAMKKWNDEFEFPKFISSNVSKFAEEFNEKYKSTLPVLRGDWTSNWDVYYQGEPDLMKKQRWVQHNLLSAEKVSAVTKLIDSNNNSLNDLIDEAYSSLLNFSGHGSGLEYGYGSPADNLITMEYREDYVHSAYLKTDEVLRRSMQRIGKAEESFEGEGLIVFNTLSWERNAPVEIQFPFETTPSYEIIDIAANKTVPSFREGYKQFFIAEDLPSLGYKKYRLQQGGDNFKISELKIGDNLIENQFYKIEFDGSNTKVKNIIDKKSVKKLINEKNMLGFSHPLIEKFQKDETFSQIKFENELIEFKDESPIRVIAKLKREGELFEETSFILWNNIDRVDIEQKVDLNKLEATEQLEEYAAAFPFDITDKKVFVEIIGGYLNPEKDKLPGTDGDGFSIRRGVALFNDEQTISWTSMDARVIRLRENENGGKVLISNIVNNFPEAWNRYEENDQKLLFRYSFTNQAGSFNPAFTSGFGWELNTPAIVSKSWYRSEPASKSYLEIDNENIILLSLFWNDEESFMLRLMNSNPFETSEAKISSEFFNNLKAVHTNYLGNEVEPLTIEENSFSVTIGPNEIRTIKIFNHKDTVKK